MTAVAPLFDLPLRVHWDARGSASREVAAAIRTAGPLAVLVQVDGIEDLDRIGLPWDGVSVAAAVGRWRQVADPRAVEGVERIEIPVGGPAEAEAVLTGPWSSLEGPSMALRWSAGRGDLASLQRMMLLAEHSGWSLTLPNPTADAITGRRMDAFPDPADIVDLPAARRAAAALGPERLAVHDFALCLALGLEGPEPAGCEAAGGLAFVDADGAVAPCSSLMIRMGTLPDESLAGIWGDPARAALRERIAGAPAACGRCDHWSRCRGGCRGAVYSLTGSFDGPDPTCYGKER